MAAQNQTNSKPAAPAAWKSLLAGATAGAVEGFATYPLEFAKTMMQFAPSSVASLSSPTKGPAVASKGSPKASLPPGDVLFQAQQTKNPLRLIYLTAQARGVSAVYVGCTSLVAGTAVKAAVRFVAFDGIKSLLVDENGKLSPARGVAAGMGAGVCESLLAVTPFDTIKTALIEDGKRAQPRYRSLVHGSILLVKERGLDGVYRGVTAVTLRQGANSAVRMGTYSWLKGQSLIRYFLRYVSAKSRVSAGSFVPYFSVHIYRYL
jgi:solute carrier family 25 citrate transporter 1